MFEKDAEEYGRKKHKERMSRWEEIQSEDVIDGFKDGAEFGYNKANEWHNSKEKLPTKDCEVLIEYGENKIHRVVDWNNKSQYFGGFSIDEVTCWKEIVLPKESE